MAGVEKDYNGETMLSPGYTVGYLEQEPQLDDSKTVREIVEEGVQEVVDALREFDEINARFAEPMDADEMDALMNRQAEVQDKLDSLNAWDLDSRLELAMDALRCPPGDTPVAVLSGGERRRVALCRLLLKEPDILLLDEPTNHLDAESVAWLEKHLQEYKGTVIAVTHDRYFLDNVAGWILELDRGYGIPWKGNYSSWLEQKQQRLAQEEKQEALRQKTLQRELDWLHMSPKARQTKRKSRINAYNELVAQEKERSNEDREIFIAPGPRLGDVVIRAESLTQGLRRQPALRKPDLRRASWRNCWHHRPQRRRQDDALPHDRGPGDSRMPARSPWAAPSSWPMWTNRAPRWTPTRPCGKKFPAATNSL